MERRLQLLLDEYRYAKVESEAKASGRSVAAVIREAIDWRFDDGHQRRQQAAVDLLAATAVVNGAEPDWSDTEAAMDDDLAAQL